ncbi:MAG TPA: FGGY family carbohydrate kinase [Acidimicrobiales bacterium]|nr:FGGY family carbohydrate kinase [Acidimicrobiales bacterium]
MILTLDLGTSSTKATIWADNGPASHGQGEVPTTHPRPGWAEQDPADWWESVVEACQQLDSAALAAVEAVAFSTARETMALVGGDRQPCGPAIVWSDRRAASEAAQLAESLGESFLERTGVVVDAGSPQAKLAWLATHEPERRRCARWVMAPRDVIVLRLTGQAVTDRTVAARAGLIDRSGSPVPIAGALLPTVLEPTDVVGPAASEPSAALGIPTGTPVIVGAGDRACEALGTGTAPGGAMVSWGTTANVSLPATTFPDPAPVGSTVSPGALDGWLVEYGLSAAGAAIEWLGRLTGRTAVELTAMMAGIEAGAAGVVAVPWLNGARAPWWQPNAQAAFFHLTSAHGPAHLARALYEAVGFDIARGLESAGGADRVAAAGGGSASAPWLSLLAAVIDRPVVRRASSADAASAGACLLAEPGFALDGINPVIQVVEPDPALFEAYRVARGRSDEACRAVLGVS